MAGWDLRTKGNCASCRQSKELELVAKLPKTFQSHLKATGHASMLCVLDMQGGCF